MKLFGGLSLGLAIAALAQQPTFGQTSPALSRSVEIKPVVVYLDPAEKLPSGTVMPPLAPPSKEATGPVKIEAIPPVVEAPMRLPAAAPLRSQAMPARLDALPVKSSTILVADTANSKSSTVKGEVAAAACQHPGCDDCLCGPDHPISFFGGLLYLKPRGVDIVYARPADGCGATAAPRGAVAVADPDYSLGYQIGAGYGLDCDSRLVLTYTRLDDQTNDSVRSPSNLILQPLVTFPGLPSCFPTTQAAMARYDIGFHLVDLDYHHDLSRSECGYLGWLIGIRYAHLDQDFEARFDVGTQTAVNTSINFDGIGPRFGLEGERMLGCSVFGYGRGSASLLAGHFGSAFNQRNIFVGTQAATTYDDDRIVPILDLELGVGWQSSGGHVRVEFGYTIAGWFNTLTTPALINGLQTGTFTTSGNNLRDVLTFDGFVARISFQF